MIDYVYSHDEETFNDESELEAAISLLNRLPHEEFDKLSLGDKLTVYRGIRVPKTASGFVNDWHVTHLIDDLQETAYDECGEYAEYFGSDISKEAKQELQTFIEQWADKHMDVSFYGVTDIEDIEVEVTKEMLE